MPLTVSAEAIGGVDHKAPSSIGLPPHYILPPPRHAYRLAIGSSTRQGPGGGEQSAVPCLDRRHFLRGQGGPQSQELAHDLAYGLAPCEHVSRRYYKTCLGLVEHQGGCQCARTDGLAQQAVCICRRVCWQKITSLTMMTCLLPGARVVGVAYAVCERSANSPCNVAIYGPFVVTKRCHLLLHHACRSKSLLCYTLLCCLPEREICHDACVQAHAYGSAAGTVAAFRTAVRGAVLCPTTFHRYQAAYNLLPNARLGTRPTT
jgi:hypothetical protein